MERKARLLFEMRLERSSAMCDGRCGDKLICSRLEKCMRIQRILIVTLAALAVSASAFSQASPQSPAVEKPLKKIVEGKITKLEWTTPHMFIYVSVTGSDTDKPTTWTMQTGNLNDLAARGI